MQKALQQSKLDQKALQQKMTVLNNENIILQDTLYPKRGMSRNPAPPLLQTPNSNNTMHQATVTNNPLTAHTGILKSVRFANPSQQQQFGQQQQFRQQQQQFQQQTSQQQQFGQQQQFTQQQQHSQQQPFQQASQPQTSQQQQFGQQQQFTQQQQHSQQQPLSTTSENTTNTNNMDPILKLSEILAKSLNTRDDKRALSSIQIKSLPKLLNCQTEISIPDFEIWKRNTLNVFKHYKVDDCLALQLIRSECGLPERLQTAITQCTSVEECFETFSKMMEPLSCLKPKLIRQITNHPKVGEDEMEQLGALDSMLQKIIHLKTFFPQCDLNEYECTAALACFQSVSHTSRLPHLTFDFKDKFKNGHKYIDILKNHFDQERTNLYLITTARNLFQDNSDDTNLMNISTEPWKSKYQPPWKPKTPKSPENPENPQPSQFWGGKGGKEGMCGVCKTSATHPYWNCPHLSEVKANKRHINSLKHLCKKCVRPHDACIAKTHNRDCTKYFNKLKRKEFSIICDTHKEVNKHLCPCPPKEQTT